MKNILRFLLKGIYLKISTLDCVLYSIVFALVHYMNASILLFAVPSLLLFRPVYFPILINFLKRYTLK